jgi:hypothetical protein
LSFSIDVTQPLSGARRFSVADWADDALAELTRQRKRRQLEDEVFIEKQRVKKAAGLPLWRDVRQKVKDNCIAFNKKAVEGVLTFEVAQEMQLAVASEIDRRHSRLSAKFDEDAGVLSWRCAGKSGQWEISASQNGSAQFQRESVPIAPESIVEEMLNALVFG